MISAVSPGNTEERKGKKGRKEGEMKGGRKE
jgi:hypothetical protein